MDIQSLKTRLDKEKIQCETLLDSIDRKEALVTSLEACKEDLLKARWVLTEVGTATQTQLKDYIEEMVTMALQSVFEIPYKFIINFNIKRNKPEAELRIHLYGNDLDPRCEVGGGVIDVASLALRIVLWTLQNPKTEGVMLLDEPLKFVHGYLENAVLLLKELSDKLKIQFIIITQLDELTQGADRIFICKHNGIYTEVENSGSP